MMAKRPLFLIMYLIFCTQIFGQNSLFKGSTNVAAKIWSRDSARKIQYSDWKTFPSHTIEMLNGFVPGEANNLCRYGGNELIRLAATGFFRTEKIKGRWSVIDPEGHPFIVSAINSFRQGKTLNNERAFTRRFETVEKWMSVSIEKFQQLGFNTAGSWSETGAIVQHNKTAIHPFAYTTQLGLLAGYVRVAVKKKTTRKNLPVLSFILDEDFAEYCDLQAKQLEAGKNDPNLLGHFSDNELAFMQTEFNDILSTEDKSDACYQAAEQWMKAKGVDATTITKDQKEAFIGRLAGVYYKIVAKAIKKYDPNHLYIGSRLHSSAKNNPHLFASANAYVDIISINYYGFWQPKQQHIADWSSWSDKPFFITEYYTKAEDAGMTNQSGAGWLVKTQSDRGIHYQNFCLELLQAKNCVGWHWFRYQDNDPSDTTADPSNSDSNKGIVNTLYEVYEKLADKMKQLNDNKYLLTAFFDLQ